MFIPKALLKIRTRILELFILALSKENRNYKGEKEISRMSLLVLLNMIERGSILCRVLRKTPELSH